MLVRPRLNLTFLSSRYLKFPLLSTFISSLLSLLHVSTTLLLRQCVLLQFLHIVPLTCYSVTKAVLLHVFFFCGGTF